MIRPSTRTKRKDRCYFLFPLRSVFIGWNNSNANTQTRREPVFPPEPSGPRRERGRQPNPAAAVLISGNSCCSVRSERNGTEMEGFRERWQQRVQTRKKSGQKNDFCGWWRREGTDSSLVWRRRGRRSRCENKFLRSVSWRRKKKLLSPRGVGPQVSPGRKLNLLAHLALPLWIIWKYRSLLGEVWLWFFPLHPTELIFGKSWHDRACWRFVICVLTGCGSEKRGAVLLWHWKKKKNLPVVLFMRTSFSKLMLACSLNLIFTVSD